MSITRREFLSASMGGAVGLATAGILAAQPAAPAPLIVDTHQHLWYLSWQKLPWLQGAPEVLSRSYVTQDYLAATSGLNVTAVYMEVDVDPAQHRAEAEHVVKLARDASAPTLAAVVGGRPDGDDFPRYVEFLKAFPEVKGIRQVLHGSTPKGHCLSDSFVKGVRLLGERGLSFDLCFRPTDLADALELTLRCPETRFILDHCGNADDNAFMTSDRKPEHDVAQWKRDIDALSRRDNVICKISGIIARVPKTWSAGDLAPIVNHCLDSFGPDRVIFGGDWPVCLLGAPLRAWVDALGAIIAERPAEAREKLWSGNAIRFYGLKLPQS